MAAYNRFTLSKEKWKKQIPKCRLPYKMKEFSSCEDLRSWSMDPEENKKWFYEMAGPSKKSASCHGSLFSQKTLVEILICYQRSELEDLKHYRALQLTEEQKRTLEHLRASRTPTEDGDGPRSTEALHESHFHEQSQGQTEYDIQSSKDELVLDEEEIGTTQAEKGPSSTDSEFYQIIDYDILAEQLIKDESDFIECENELKKLKIQILALEEEKSELQYRQETEMNRLLQKLNDIEEERDVALTEMNKYKQAMKQSREQEGHIQALISEKNALSQTLEHLSGIAISYKDLESKLKDCEQVKKERDVLRMKLQDYSQLEQDLNLYKYRAHESEVLRLERDRLQEQLDKMSILQTTLQRATKRNEELEACNEQYRRRLEELSNLESLNSTLGKKLQEEINKNNLLSKEIDKCKYEVLKETMKVEKLTEESLQHKAYMESQISELEYKLQLKEYELQELQQKLTETLSKADCLCEERDLQIENLTAHLEEMNLCTIKNLEAKQTEVDHLQDSLRKLSDEYQKTLTDYDNAKMEELEELLRNLKNFEERNEQLNKLLMESHLEKEQMENRCTVLKQKLEEVSFENSKLMEELKTRPGADDLKFLHEENEKLRNRLKQMSDRSDYLEDELKKACTCLEHEKKSSQAENIILLNNIEASKAKDYIDLLDKNQNLQDELQNTLKSFSLLKSELNDRPTKEDMILLEREVAKLRLEQRKWQASVKDSNEKDLLETKVNELSLQLNDYIKKNELLETETRELHLHLEDITSKKLEVETKINELHLDLEDAIRQKNEINENYEASIQDNKNEILKLQQEITKLKGDLETYKKDSFAGSSSAVVLVKDSIDKLSMQDKDSSYCNLKDILGYITQKLCEIDTTLLKESTSLKQKEDNEELIQHLITVKEEKQILEEELRHLSDTLCYQIDEMQNNLTEEKQRNEEALEIIKELTINMKDENEKREAAENSLRSAQMELQSLQAILKNCDKNTDNFVHQMNDLQCKLEVERRDTMKLNHLLEVSEIQLKTLESSVEHITRSREDTVKKFDECKEELRIHRNIIENMTIQNNSLKEHNLRLQTNIEMLHETIEELRTVEEEKVNLSKIIQSLEEEKRFVETEKHILEERVQDMEEANELLIKENRKLQSEKMPGGQIQKQSTSFLDMEKWELKDELEKSVSSLKIAMEEKNTLEIVNNNLKESLSGLEKSLNVKDETIALLKSDLENFHGLNGTLNKELDDLQKKYLNMKGKCQCLESECEYLRDHIENLTSELLEISSALTSQEEEVKSIKDYLLKQSEKSDGMENNLPVALTSLANIDCDCVFKMLAIEAAERCQCLENKLKECQNSNKKLLNANKKLKEDIHRLNLKIGKEVTLKDRKESKIKIDNKLKDLENEFTAPQNIVHLEDLNYMKDTITDLMQNNKDLEKQYEETVKVKNNLENKLEACIKLNENLMDKIKNLEGELSKHKSLLRNNRGFVELEEKNMKTTDCLQTCEMELASYKQQNYYLNNIVKDMKKKIEHLETVVKENKLLGKHEIERGSRNMKNMLPVDYLDADVTGKENHVDRSTDSFQDKIANLCCCMQESDKKDKLNTNEAEKFMKEIEELKNKVRLCEEQKTKLTEELDNLKRINITEEIRKKEEKLNVLKDENNELKIAVKELEKERDNCMRTIEELRKKLDRDVSENDVKQRIVSNEVRERCESDLKKLRLEYDNKIKYLSESHKKEIESLNSNCQNTLSDLKNSFEREKTTIRSEHEQKIQQLLKSHNEEMKELQNKYESEVQKSPYHKRSDSKLIQDAEKLKEDMELEYDEKQKTALKNLQDHTKKLKDKIKEEEYRLQTELDRITNEHNEKLAQLREKYDKLTKTEEERFKHEREKIKRKTGLLEVSEIEMYEIFPGGKRKGKGSLIDVNHREEKGRTESTASDTSLIEKLSEGDTKDRADKISKPRLKHILRKAYRHGLEVLSLNQLTLLHQHVTSATSALVLKTHSQNLNIPENMKLTPGSPEDEKWKLVALTAKLQHSLKQQEEAANIKARDMEEAINRGQRKIFELKHALEKYKKQNSMLNDRVIHQDESISDLKVQKDKLEQSSEQELRSLQTKLNKEEKRIQELEAALAHEREKVKYLEKLLMHEKTKSSELLSKCVCKQSLGRKKENEALEQSRRNRSQHFQSHSRTSAKVKEFYR